MLIVIAIVFAVLLYRLAVAGALYRAVQNLNGGPSAADFVVLLTGSLLQLVAILVMNKVCTYNIYCKIENSCERENIKFILRGLKAFSG